MKTLYFLLIAIFVLVYTSLISAVSADDTNSNQWNKLYLLSNHPPNSNQVFIAQYRITNATLQSITGNNNVISTIADTSDKGLLEIKFPRNFPYHNGESTSISDFFILINGFGSFSYYHPGTPMTEDARKQLINTVDRLPPNPESYSDKDDCYYLFSIPFYTFAKIDINYGLNGLITLPYHGDDVPQYCNQQTIAEHLTPLKQFKLGIAAKNVKCDSGLQLIIKDNDTPACMKPQTAQKLAERGWGTIVTSQTSTSCQTGQTMVNGQCVTSIPVSPTSTCSAGYTVIQISAGTYLCQPTNPPQLSNATSYSIGEKVGAFTIGTINPYNVTGYYNSPYPIAHPGLGEFTIMHVGDTLNPTCDGSAPLVITAINYPYTITVSVGESLGRAIHGCPICLSADSVIRTPSGDINVKNIQDGMTVWSTNPDGTKIKSKIIKIDNVFVGDTHKVIDLQLSDGRELSVSPNHPTSDGRIIADLKVGETYDGSEIKSIKLVDYKYQFTYDILPDSQTGNYWANGILVGSTLK